MRRAARLLSRQQQTSHIRYAATQAVGLRIINSISDSSVEGTDVSHLPVNPSGSHAGIGITRQRSFASSQPVNPEQIAQGVCWSCQASDKTADTLFCGSCGAIMPIDRTQNYFSLMSLKDGEYSIDDSILDRQYKHLQRQLHPDKFSSKSEQEQDMSAEASSLVNEAFSTLKSPLKRGEYLLKLRGIEVGEGTMDDPEMLTIIMDAREAIEATSSHDELGGFATIFQQQAGNCIKGIEEAFRKSDMEKAQNLVATLKYVTNIQAAILEKL